MMRSDAAASISTLWAVCADSVAPVGLCSADVVR